MGEKHFETAPFIIYSGQCVWTYPYMFRTYSYICLILYTFIYILYKQRNLNDNSSLYITQNCINVGKLFYHFFFPIIPLWWCFHNLVDSKLFPWAVYFFIIVPPRINALSVCIYNTAVFVDFFFIIYYVEFRILLNFKRYIIYYCLDTLYILVPFGNVELASFVGICNNKWSFSGLMVVRNIYTFFFQCGKYTNIHHSHRTVSSLL